MPSLDTNNSHTTGTGMTGTISVVQLPSGEKYEIHDANAIHGIDVTGVFVFQGSKADEATIKAITSARAGDVWHATAEGTEWLCTKDISEADATAWEEIGNPFVDTHIHDVTVSGSMSGSVTGVAKNATTVTATDIITKATASGTAVGANGTASVVKSYPGVSEKLVTTSVNSAGADVTASKVSRTTSKLATTTIKGVSGTTSVINSVTPSSATLSPVSIAGVSGSTTASKATAGTKVAVAKAGTAQSIPNVTGNASVTASKVSNLAQRTIPNVTNKGTASTWSFEVKNGILTISGANSTTPTLGTAISATYLTATDVTATNTALGDPISVTPAVSNGSITPYTFADVTVPKAATATKVAGLTSATNIVTGIETGDTTVATAAASETTVATGSVASNGAGATVVTGVTSTDVTAAGPASAVTVATGQTDVNGAGESVLVGLGTPTTATALTGVKVTAQPTITLAAGTAGTTGHFKTGENVVTGTTDLALEATAGVSGTLTGSTGLPK